MSETVIELPGLIVTRIVGPITEGEDRQRWELVVLDSDRGCARLTRVEVVELAHALIRDATKPRAES